jgi:O-antigen/teichoic acid export membrane protein
MILNNRFYKNIKYVLQANVIAQASHLLVAPILTRFFSPDDFSVLAVFSAYTAIILSFFTFKFDWLVPNAKSRQQALGLCWLSFFAIILFMLISIIFYHYGSSMVPFIGHNYDIIAPYHLVLILSVITGSVVSIFQGWFVYIADFKDSSNARLVNAVSNNIYRLASGYFQVGASGLLWSTVLGNISAIISQSYAVTRSWYKDLLQLSLSDIFSTFKYFYKEAILSSFTSLANAISLAVLPLLLAAYYSAQEVGWYALVSRLSLAPLGLITSAIMQSFWAEAAILIKEDKPKLRELYLSASCKLALLSLPVVVVCLCAPFYMTFLFGDEWHGAAYVLMALTPMIVAQVIVSPLTHLIVHEKQLWQLVWDIIRTVVTVLLIVTSGYIGVSLVMVVLMVSLFYFLMYGLLFLYNLYLLSIDDLAIV